MKKDISTLVRKNIAELVPYSSARDEYTGTDAVLLDANENPFNDPYNRYPDPHQILLKEKIGELKRVIPENIFLGNGSDEAIDILFRVFCEPGIDNVLAIAPTYGMYKVCADVNNIAYREVLLKKDFSLDCERIKEAADRQTKLLFLCSPNNPTSNSFQSSEILHLADSLDLIVIVDEAYIDFSLKKSLVEELRNHKNLVVLQTFSKAYGMAGIRLGMALAHSEIISLMGKVKYPYNINILTMKFALETIENVDMKEKWVEMILKERRLLERRLKKYRFVEKIYPSDANFLLVKVRNAKLIYHFLVENKIIVRDRSNIERCYDCLRITVGTESENSMLEKALMDYQRDYIDSCKI